MFCNLVYSFSSFAIAPSQVVSLSTNINTCDDMKSLIIAGLSMDWRADDDNEEEQDEEESDSVDVDDEEDEGKLAGVEVAPLERAATRK